MGAAHRQKDKATAKGNHQCPNAQTALCARHKFFTRISHAAIHPMAVTTSLHHDEISRDHCFENTNCDYRRAAASAVSWGAILAGAAAAASLALILLILGVGLGLSSVSPWYREGISASTFGTSTILWLTATQLLASALGGYLAGRLRTKWIEVHTDEVYFRDTAHGFLAWAVASLVSAGLLTSVIGSIVGGGIHAGASVAGGTIHTATMMAGHTLIVGAKHGAREAGPLPYFIDTLFRRDLNAPLLTSAEGTMPADIAERRSGRDLAEVTRIFMHVGDADSLPPEDVRYVSQIVSQHTGLSQQESERRVIDTYERVHAQLQEAKVAAKDVADETRKASAHGALWLFVSLLVGAFVASLSATFGGRRRDA